jgi:hypothetical protein
MRWLLHATIEKLLGEVFSVQSVPGLCNEEQLRFRESLETAVRRVGGWCEMAASLEVISSNKFLVRQSSASKDVKTEAEEATALEAVTRRRPVKMQQTVKDQYVL